MPRKERTDQELHPENYFTSPQGHVRDRIVLHESERLPREGQLISLNGFAFLAKAGVPIDLPRPVRLMIDTLIERQTLQGDDGKEYTRDIPRFTDTLVKEGVNLPEETAPVDGG